MSFLKRRQGKNRNRDRILPVIFMVENTGRMPYDIRSAVNKSIKDTVEKLAEENMNHENPSVIKVAVMHFSSSAWWINDELMDPQKLDLPDVAGCGEPNLGNALLALERKLSRKAFFKGKIPYGALRIYLISYGAYNDPYEPAVSRLKKNKWYARAWKTGFTLGSWEDRKQLAEIVDGIHGTVELDDFYQIRSKLLNRLVEEEVIRSSSKELDDMWENISGSPIRWDELTLDDWESCRISGNIFSGDQDDRDGDGIALPEINGEWAFNDPVFDDPGEECWEGPLGECFESMASMLQERQENVLHGDEEYPVDEFGRIMLIPAGTGLKGVQFAGGAVRCPGCDEVVLQDHKFCPHCGTPMTCRVEEQVSVSQVEFSAVVPRNFIRGECAMVGVTMYEEAYRHIVDRIIATADEEVREVVGTTQEVPDRTSVRIKLTAEGLELSDCEDVQVWRGRYLNFSFPVDIPENFQKKQIRFRALVYFNDVIASRLVFVAQCTSPKDEKIRLIREDVMSAFISYATEDRNEVVSIIQGMKKARNDLNIFMDIDNLNSGEYWERVIQREIENRDILYLCWSGFAKASEWVEKEWRYALENKGLDGIEPIPLVPPVECPPPKELESKHFNDRLLMYREAKCSPKIIDDWVS